MCERHSFCVLPDGTVLHGYGLTNSHRMILALAGVTKDGQEANAYEWQPPEGWPNADWRKTLTKDLIMFDHESVAPAIEAHLREWYPTMAEWEAPDLIRDFPHTSIDCDLVIPPGATFTAHMLAEVSGSFYVGEGATFTAPVLAKSGYVDVHKGATFTAPMLKKPLA